MMQIVPTNMGHIGEIAELEKLCFPDPWSVTMLADELANPHSICLSAVTDAAGEVLGHITMRHIINEGHINNLAVHPQFRRQKVASQLINELLNAAIKREIIGITLEVRESNTAAIALYESYGFVREGLRKNYYQLPTENAIIMWRYIMQCGGCLCAD